MSQAPAAPPVSHRSKAVSKKPAAAKEASATKGKGKLKIIFRSQLLFQWETSLSDFARCSEASITWVFISEKMWFVAKVT